MITWTNLHEEAYQALVSGRSGDAEYIYRMSRGAISESSFRAIKYKASQHPRNQILSKLSQLDVEGAKQLHESNPGCIEQILYDSCLAKAVQEKQRLAEEGIWEEITEALRLREFPKAQTLCALLPANTDNERRYLLLYEQATSQVRSEQKGKITHLLLNERELDADALYERKASKWWARDEPETCVQKIVTSSTCNE